MGAFDAIQPGDNLTVIVICGHGSVDGQHLVVGVERTDHQFWAVQFDKVSRHSHNLRLATFFSCYVGLPGGLVDRLSDCCPITTISFARPILKRDTLPSVMAIGSLIFLHWYYYYTGRQEAATMMALIESVWETNAHRLLLYSACEAVSAVNGLSQCPPTATPDQRLYCQPIMRNDNGFTDPKWWPIEAVNRWHAENPTEIAQLIWDINVHAAFYHPRMIQARIVRMTE